MSPTLTNETRRRLSPNLFRAYPRRRRSWTGILLMCWAATAAAALAAYALRLWYLSTFAG